MCTVRPAYHPGKICIELGGMQGEAGSGEAKAYSVKDGLPSTIGLLDPAKECRVLYEMSLQWTMILEHRSGPHCRRLDVHSSRSPSRPIRSSRSIRAFGPPMPIMPGALPRCTSSPSHRSRRIRITRIPPFYIAAPNIHPSSRERLARRVRLFRGKVGRDLVKVHRKLDRDAWA